MTLRGYIAVGTILAFIASNGFSLWKGYGWGEAAQQAKHDEALKAVQDALDNVTTRVTQAEAERLEAQRERDDLLAELDRAGDAADGAGRLALPADSVRRIDRIGRED